MQFLRPGLTTLSPPSNKCGTYHNYKIIFIVYQVTMLVHVNTATNAPSLTSNEAENLNPIISEDSWVFCLTFGWFPKLTLPCEAEIQDWMATSVCSVICRSVHRVRLRSLCPIFFGVSTQVPVVGFTLSDAPRMFSFRIPNHLEVIQ